MGLTARGHGRVTGGARAARADHDEADVTERTADGARHPLLPEGVYRRALAVGRTAAGVSGPNPPVGCVLVRDGQVIAEGATGPTGSAHAEVSALRSAGASAVGATAVVTLEPCAHHGRTPPCVDALLEAGIAEVHVLVRDPDPVAKGGLARLAAAGVTTLDVGAEREDLAAQARFDLRGFIARVRHGRPHVTLKLAQTPDGRTTPPVGGYLTGEVARRRVHELRALSDAVLVGGETLRTDDPQLDVRHVACERQPRPVILSSSGDVLRGARALRSGALVLHGPDADRSIAEWAAELGVTPILVPAAGPSELDLAAALALLLEHRVLTVLAEPGPRLASALLEGGLVDRIELHVAGGADIDATNIRPSLPSLAPLLTLGDVERDRTPDGDLLLATDVTRIAPHQLEEVA